MNAYIKRQAPSEIQLYVGYHPRDQPHFLSVYACVHTQGSIEVGGLRTVAQTVGAMTQPRLRKGGPFGGTRPLFMLIA